MYSAVMRMLIAFLFTLAIVTPVQAQDLSKKEKQKLSNLVRQAQRAQQAGERLAKRKKTRSKAMARYKSAAQSYLEAYKIKDSSSILFFLADIYQRRGELAWALRGYKRYLELEPDGQYSSACSDKIAEIGELDDPYQAGDADIDPIDLFGEMAAPVEEVPVSEEAPPVEKEAVVKTRELVPPVSTKPSSSGKALRFSGLGTAGLGLVFVGVGIKFGLDAKTASDDLSGRSGSWRAEDQALISDGESAEKKSLIFSILGVTSLLGGGALYYLGHKKKKEQERTQTSSLVPSMNADGASLSWIGSF